MNRTIRDGVTILLSAGTGAALLFLVRYVEQLADSVMLFTVFVEEGAKASLFLLLLLVYLIRYKQKKGLSLDLLLIPFFGICFFALTENMIYYLSFPTTFVYVRLVASFMVHVNSGLAFFMVAASGKWILAAPVFSAAVFYHWMFNRFAVGEGLAITFAVSALNILIFIMLLFPVMRNLVPRRCIRDRETD